MPHADQTTRANGTANGHTANGQAASGHTVAVAATHAEITIRPQQRNTWSCLTRLPGQPWRVNPPTGPAMPPRWVRSPLPDGAGNGSPPDNGRSHPSAVLRASVGSRHHPGPLPGEQGTKKLRSAAVGSAGPMPSDFRFGRLELSEPVRRAVWEAGYCEPMPIQDACVPILLAGKDCVGQAHTGTGKTAAFGLPIVERVDTDKNVVQAVVLVPTRELCRQVTGEIERLGEHRGVKVLAVYGGEGMERQLRALAAGVHVVVGTPGRVQDHIWRGTLRLDGVRIAILDEADEMLDIGFAEAIEAILRCMPNERQSALFSATIPSFVHRLVRKYLIEPEWVSTIDASQNGASRIPQLIRQSFVHVAERDKLEALEELIKSEPGYDRVLIFRRMKILVDRLASAMQRKGYSARALHGDLPQGERNRVLEDFRSGKLQFLIATNVAARGLDIVDVSHVLNYDLPDTPEEYTHRIGRTGRAGKNGTAVSFVGEWDFEAFEAIKSHVGDALRERKLALYGE
ncbi:MAG: DEAD/DEAH box helicase [Chloroflexi bacterium]|nr:DEAD/DEAH box helicase [Chloroflexota bacterium]